MQITDWQVREWDVPMRSPYRSAQRLTTTAHNVLVSVTVDGQFTGYGESAPATYVTGETQATVADALRRFFAHHAPASPEEMLVRATRELADSPGAKGAVEIAVHDAAARAASIPLYKRFAPALSADALLARSTDISFSIMSPEEAGVRAAAAAAQGFRAIKIKIGSGEAEDVARVRAVADAAPNATLRLDGNQAFSPETALSLFDKLTDLFGRIEMLEQPTPAGDNAAMQTVHRSLPDAIPVFADESCHDAADATRLIESGICGGVVLKLAKSGLSGAEAIAKAAFAAGGTAMFGCMMETHIGIGAAFHLTIALGQSAVSLLDLDGHLLTDDAAELTGGFAQDGDMLIVSPDIAGLGISLLRAI